MKLRRHQPLPPLWGRQSHMTNDFSATGRSTAVWVWVEPRSWVPPPERLGHLHICERPTGDHDLETSQPHVEGDRSGWPMGGVSAPSAELCDDPCCPSESVGGM